MAVPETSQPPALVPAAPWGSLPASPLDSLVVEPGFRGKPVQASLKQ
jgi:hypothetical protein